MVWKGRGFCQIAGESSGADIPPIVPLLPWVAALRSKYTDVFKAGLGTCHTYMVHKFPFRFPLSWKSQPRSPMTGPAEEGKVLEEVLKLVKLGAVREVTHEPYIIPAFGVPKKNGSTRLVLDFQKFNSCVQHQPFLPVHHEMSLASLCPFRIGSSLDLSNAYLQVQLAPCLWKAVVLAVAGRFFEYMRLPFRYSNSLHEFF